MKPRIVNIGLLVVIWACLSSVECALGQSTPDRFFHSDGTRIRYQVSGQGPAVVLLHGFGENLEGWHRGDVVRVLSRHFQVIMMDVRGHGLSSKPHNPKSYGPELAADVVRLLRHLRKSKAHIVGYSMGALIALDFAVLYQEQALSVILVGAGWNPPDSLNDFKQMAEAYEQGRTPVRDGDDAKALAALLRSLRVLSEREIRGIGVPMAAVIGANDRFMSNVQRLSHMLNSVQIKIIPNANHATTPSHPIFAQTLLALLKEKAEVL